MATTKKEYGYHESNTESIAILIGIYERDIDALVVKRVDIFQDGQVQIPFLKEIDDRIVVGVDNVSKTLGEEFQFSKESFLTSLERSMTELIFAVALSPHKLSKTVRWPYHDESYRQKLVRHVMQTECRQFKTWLELYGGEECKDPYAILDLIHDSLDKAEGILANDGKMGIWLDGIRFGKNDCRLVAVLMTLHQLGLDEMWIDGKRPNLAMYVHQSFNRPSVIRATQWKDHEGQVAYFDDEASDVSSARYALFFALGIVGAYLVKKTFKS